MSVGESSGLSPLLLKPGETEHSHEAVNSFLSHLLFSLLGGLPISDVLVYRK